MEKLKEMVLLGQCGGGPCPRVFLAKDGSLIVQGLKVEESLKTELNPAPNEDVVKLPKEIVEQVIENYRRHVSSQS